MRILRISCGIAALFTSLAYAHILPLHFWHAPPDDYIVRRFGRSAFSLFAPESSPSLAHFSS